MAESVVTEGDNCEKNMLENRFLRHIDLQKSLYRTEVDNQTTYAVHVSHLTLFFPVL